MSSALKYYERPGLPVAPERPTVAGAAPQPEPTLPVTVTPEVSTTYDAHDRVPLADADTEC